MKEAISKVTRNVVDIISPTTSEILINYSERIVKLEVAGRENLIKPLETLRNESSVVFYFLPHRQILDPIEKSIGIEECVRIKAREAEIGWIISYKYTHQFPSLQKMNPIASATGRQWLEKKGYSIFPVVQNKYMSQAAEEDRTSISRLNDESNANVAQFLSQGQVILLYSPEATRNKETAGVLRFDRSAGILPMKYQETPFVPVVLDMKNIPRTGIVTHAQMRFLPPIYYPQLNWIRNNLQLTQEGEKHPAWEDRNKRRKKRKIEISDAMALYPKAYYKLNGLSLRQIQQDEDPWGVYSNQLIVPFDAYFYSQLDDFLTVESSDLLLDQRLRIKEESTEPGTEEQIS